METTMQGSAVDVGESSNVAIEPMATGGFGIRFAGRLIDMVAGMVSGLVGGIIGGIVLAVLAQMGTVGPDWVQKVGNVGSSLLSSIAWGLLGGILYASVSEGVGGTTFGKWVLGYRVVQEDLKPCGFGAALKRSVAYLVDAFFFGLPAYNAMQNGAYNQRLGDKWAKTMVVKTSALPASARRSGGLIALGLLCGMFAQVVVSVISIVSKAM